MELDTALSASFFFDGQVFLVKIPPWGISCYNFHGSSSNIVTVIHGV